MAAVTGSHCDEQLQMPINLATLWLACTFRLMSIQRLLLLLLLLLPLRLFFLLCIQLAYSSKNVAPIGLLM
jgi:hypothetical protein